MKKTRILVVDDELSIIKFLRVNLEAKGYEALVAMDGAQALQTSEMELPDIVILDIMMPFDLEGLVVSRRIRGELGMGEVPIIMVTALSRDLMGPYKVVPDDFIPVNYFIDKPADPDKLLAMIQNVLPSNTESP